MKMQFEVPSEVGYATLTAYQQFEFDIRDAIGFYELSEKEKGRGVEKEGGRSFKACGGRERW